MKKILCYILLILLILTTTNANVTASQSLEISTKGSSISKTVSNSNEHTAKKIDSTLNKLKELKSNRSQNAKFYIDNKKVITAHITNYPQHYYSEKNKTWEDIENKIIPIKNSRLLSNSESEYEEGSEANSFKIKFGSVNKPKVNYSTGEYSISYLPLNIANNIKKEYFEDTLTYKGAWESTDLTYKIMNDRLKMNIILKTKDAPKSFTFLIDVDKVKISDIDKDGNIYFLNDKNESIATIPRMWVKQEGDKEILYDRIDTSLYEKDGKTYLTVNVNDEGLNYPLIIDPTTVETYNTRFLTYKVNINIPDMKFQNIQYMYFQNYFVPHTDDNGDVNPHHPMNVYLTETNEEGENLFGKNVSPVDDGTLGVKIGETSHQEFDEDKNAILSSLTIDDPSSLTAIPANKLVKGIAFWKYELHNYWDMRTEVYIEYTSADFDSGIPTTPILMINNVTRNSISLKWTPSRDDVAVKEYNIYSHPKNELLATTNSTTLNYEFLNLSKNTFYQYYIVAKDNSGNVSNKSNVQTVKTYNDSTLYNYNRDGRLRSVIYQDGTTFYFYYDGNGNLISSRVD